MGLKLNKNALNESILEEIKNAINSISYGSVLIKVHDNKIIQIELTEKKRFDDTWKLEEGGGI